MIFYKLNFRFIFIGSFCFSFISCGEVKKKNFEFSKSSNRSQQNILSPTLNANPSLLEHDSNSRTLQRISLISPKSNTRNSCWFHATLSALEGLDGWKNEFCQQGRKADFQYWIDQTFENLTNDLKSRLILARRDLIFKLQRYLLCHEVGIKPSFNEITDSMTLLAQVADGAKTKDQFQESWFKVEDKSTNWSHGEPGSVDSFLLFLSVAMIGFNLKEPHPITYSFERSGARYCDGFMGSIPVDSDKDRVQSVVFHAPGGGHFVAYVKQNDGSFIEFDDSNNEPLTLRKQYENIDQLREASPYSMGISDQLKVAFICFDIEK